MQDFSATWRLPRRPSSSTSTTTVSRGARLWAGSWRTIMMSTLTSAWCCPSSPPPHHHQCRHQEHPWTLTSWCRRSEDWSRRRWGNRWFKQMLTICVCRQNSPNLIDINLINALQCCSPCTWSPLINMLTIKYFLPSQNPVLANYLEEALWEIFLWSREAPAEHDHGGEGSLDTSVWSITEWRRVIPILFL